MSIESLYELFLAYPNAETDTRKITPGSIFFALKGPNFNGNTFARQALDSGAAYAIIDEDPGFADDRLIQVPDSLATLQQLALHHRRQFDIPVIGITGSNGKTTTKELIHSVLSTSFKTYTTEGNLNNHIGVPLTLLRIRPDAEMVVIEMGANHIGEIRSYCNYTLPTHGLITNCGKAHLEGFGGEAGVRKGKGELFDFLRAHGGTAWIYHDMDYLREMSLNIPRVITYGQTDAEITGEAATKEGMLSVKITKGMAPVTIKTQLVGAYNLPNVLAAIAVGLTFQVPDEKIIDALENYIPSNSRSQLLIKNGNRVILDAYNANPSSMKAAIENFARLEGDNKILILGGMKELGEDSISEHAAIISLIKQYPWKYVILAGKEYHDVPEGIMHMETSEEARDWFQSKKFTGMQILVKGSRGMQMEKVLEEK